LNSLGEKILVKVDRYLLPFSMAVRLVVTRLAPQAVNAGRVKPLIGLPQRSWLLGPLWVSSKSVLHRQGFQYSFRLTTEAISCRKQTLVFFTHTCFSMRRLGLVRWCIGTVVRSRSNVRMSPENRLFEIFPHVLGFFSYCPLRNRLFVLSC
jgi:hypothetical protein